MPTEKQAKADKPTWYKIQNATQDEAEILIYEQIGEDWWGGGVSAKRFTRDLKALGDIKRITLRINSPGGAVFDGNAIYNTLKAHKAKKTVYIDGLAASIASVIAMAGDEIIMPANAMLMIHDPWTMAVGDANEMRKTADMLDKVRDSIMTTYRRSGQDDATISQMMADETWMTAEEAVDLGFADKIDGSVKAAASAFDLSRFKNVPQALQMDVTPTPVREPEASISQKQEDQTMTITLEKLKNEAPELIAQLKKEGKTEAMAELETVKNSAKEEGRQEERERIQAIEALVGAGFDDIVNEAKFDGKTQAADVALKIVAAQKKVQSNTLIALRNESPNPVEPDNTGAESTDADNDPTKDTTPLASLEEAEKLYNADERVRKAFSSAKNFYAYRKHAGK